MSAIVGNVPFFSQFIRHCFQTSSLASFENKFCRKGKTVLFSQWFHSLSKTGWYKLHCVKSVQICK